eukprot:3997826-Pyramimonas_sp.AAC.1
MHTRQDRWGWGHGSFTALPPASLRADRRRRGQSACSKLTGRSQRAAGSEGPQRGTRRVGAVPEAER